MLLGEFDGEMVFLLFTGRFDTGFVQKAMDLRLDPRARVRRHGAQRVPFAVSQIHGDKSTGILVHCASRAKTLEREYRPIPHLQNRITECPPSVFLIVLAWRCAADCAGTRT